MLGWVESLFMLGCVKNNASRENWSMCFSLAVNVCLVWKEAERHENRRETWRILTNTDDKDVYSSS